MSVNISCVASDGIWKWNDEHLWFLIIWWCSPMVRYTGLDALEDFILSAAIVSSISNLTDTFFIQFWPWK